MIPARSASYGLDEATAERELIEACALLPMPS